MKKIKNLKGFTLVECIVAIAILGIASLALAQIYGAVSKINVENHRVNESLSKTVENVEKTNSAATGFAIIKLNNIANTKITFTKDSGTFAASGTAPKYEMDMKNTNVYVYCAQDTVVRSGQSSKNYTDPDSDQIGLRYKYFAYTP